MKEGRKELDNQKVKSVFTFLGYELMNWTKLVQFVHSQGEQWSQGALWPSYIRYPLCKSNKLISGWSLDSF